MKALDKVSQILKEEFVINLLKKFNFYDKIIKDNEFARNGKFNASETKMLKFAKELLKDLISVKIVREFYSGLDKNHSGLTTLYSYAQLEQIFMLYYDLKNKTRLYEIGTKRCDAKHVIEIIEKVTGEEVNIVGKALIYNSPYTLLESEKTGVFVSTCVNEEERLFMQDSDGNVLGGVVFNTSYIGIVIPGFDLCYKIAKALNEQLDNNEIEWPYNRLGGISIRDLSRENVSIEQAKINKAKKDYQNDSPFHIKTDSELIVKNLI